VIQPPSSIDVLGCRVDNVTMAESVAWCDALIQAGRPAYVVTPNAEIVMQAQRMPDLRRLINSSQLSIPDGASLLLAGRMLGRPLREQVTGTDLSYELARLASRRGYRMFLLGAAEGVAQAAAARLVARYPGLQIAGTFGGWSRPEGDAETRAAVAAAAPVDILLVAYGAPWQERWIGRNAADLDVKLAMGVGGVFDFIAGRVRRAPRWLRRIGFDWLFRLAVQPWRWRRQLTIPQFLWQVLLERARRARRPAAPAQ